MLTVNFISESQSCQAQESLPLGPASTRSHRATIRLCPPQTSSTIRGRSPNGLHSSDHYQCIFCHNRVWHNTAQKFPVSLNLSCELRVDKRLLCFALDAPPTGKTDPLEKASPGQIWSFDDMHTSRSSFFASGEKGC